MRLEIYDGWNGETPTLTLDECPQALAWETVSRIMLDPKGQQGFHQALYKECLPGTDIYFTVWEVTTRIRD